MSVLGQSLNLLSSILTILLTCPDSNTLLCYSNDPFLTVRGVGSYYDTVFCLTGIADQTHSMWSRGIVSVLPSPTPQLQMQKQQHPAGEQSVSIT